MKFGIGIPVAHQGEYCPTPFAGPNELVTIVQTAERLGFHSAWGLDFMTPRHDPEAVRGSLPEWYEVLTALTYLAGKTSRIRLGTGALQVPLRDPFLLARQAATLDVLSGGRFMLGVGLGTYRVEFERIRARDKGVHRGQLFVESLEALHRFFSEDIVTFTGKHYSCRDLCMVPKPVQQPFPLYITGTTDDVTNRIAAWGSGWLLSRAQSRKLDERLEQLDRSLAAVGRRRSAIDLVVSKGLSLGRSREEALERFYHSILPTRMDSMATALNVGGKPSEDLAMVFEQNLIGTPDDVIEQLAAVRAKSIDHCILYYFPAPDVRELLDQVQWFGEAVMPAFAGR